MIKYKEGLLQELAAKGYTANRMRKERILSESTMQHIREGKDVNTSTINTICIILRCQPSDIITVEATDAEKIKFF